MTEHRGCGGTVLVGGDGPVVRSMLRDAAGHALLSTRGGADWLCVPGSGSDLEDDDDYETFARYVRAISSDYDDVEICRGRTREIAGHVLARVEPASPDA